MRGFGEAVRLKDHVDAVHEAFRSLDERWDIYANVCYRCLFVCSSRRTIVEGGSRCVE
jgi:hypothetical protein